MNIRCLHSFAAVTALAGALGLQPLAAQVLPPPAAPELPILEQALERWIMPEETLSVPLPAGAAPAGQAVVQRPLIFERNDGQTAPEVSFLSRGRGYILYLTAQEAVIRLPQRSKLADPSAAHHPVTHPSSALEELPDDPVPSRVLRMQLVGSNPDPKISGEQELRAKVNYFKGNQPALWHTNVPTYARVRYHQVYPGIDLVYYERDGRLEYDFVVSPGADPTPIVLSFQGADGLKTERGDLVLTVAGQEVRWRKPVVYQEVNGTKQEIACDYRLNPLSRDSESDEASLVSFALAKYDPTAPLLIDPTLVYSSYLGGSGADYAESVAVDRDGNTYIGGETMSVDFPTKAALFTNNFGDRDCFIMKVSPKGELLFSTYIGGSAQESRLASKIKLSPSGACYIVGTTLSWDFPMVNPYQGYFGGGEWDTFVSALSPDGSALLYSTYLGGSDRDNAWSIAFGPEGDIYVVGATRSADFPISNAYQKTLSQPYEGTQHPDGFITRLKADGPELVYSTFWGRSSYLEQVRDVVVDRDGQAFVVSNSDCVGSTDCYAYVLAKFGAYGTNRLFEVRTSCVGPFLDFNLALGPSGKLVFAGTTAAKNLRALNRPHASLDWPVGFSEGYIVHHNATNGAYVAGVYLGGSGNDRLNFLSLGDSGLITASGWAAGQDYAPLDFPQTHFMPSWTGTNGAGGFITQLRLSDMKIEFSTIATAWGSSAGAMPSEDTMILVGTIYDSASFPDILNGFQPTPAGDYEGFVAKIALGEWIKVSRLGINLRLSWPLTATGYVLESADSPIATTWNRVPNAPVPEGDQNVVTLEIGAGSQFFRLRGS